jgi:hypothetical protein
LELFASLLCVMLFTPTAERTTKTPMVLRGTTDNQSNESLVIRHLTTKYPSYIVLLELTEQCASKRIQLDLRWQTRSENQHADDLTNEVFKDFCDMMSVRYGFVVGTRTGQGDDFIADPDQINRLLDQMDACPSPADAVF